MRANERLEFELKVFLTGRVAVETDDRVLDEERFPGRQGRLVFAYLVAEGGRPVPRDELADALWGEAPPATWEKALTVVVSRLRGLLAEHGIESMVKRGPGFDVPEFLAGGPRQIFVLESVAEEAREVLAGTPGVS